MWILSDPQNVESRLARRGRKSSSIWKKVVVYHRVWPRHQTRKENRQRVKSFFAATGCRLQIDSHLLNTHDIVVAGVPRQCRCSTESMFQGRHLKKKNMQTFITNAYTQHKVDSWYPFRRISLIGSIKLSVSMVYILLNHLLVFVFTNGTRSIVSFFTAKWYIAVTFKSFKVSNFSIFHLKIVKYHCYLLLLMVYIKIKTLWKRRRIIANHF